MFRASEASNAPTPAPEWSVYVTLFENGNEASRTKVWTGKVGSCPTPTNISDMISNSTSIETLEDLAAQLCKSAPVQAISGLLSCLSCNFWRSNAAIDIRKLQRLADAENRSVCGYVFKQGDIVWTCRQCAKDPTCVQCDKCFRKSDHEGHEVYFHRATGGGSGCCDCGDEEAWSRAGNCIDHNHPSRDNCSTKDPLESVPPELVKGMRPVLKGAISVIVSYIIATVRGFSPLDSNLFYLECRERIEPLVARVHNDDMHTYDQVIHAFSSIGFDAFTSEQFTRRIDKEGEAVVCTASHTGLDKIRQAHQRLATAAGLLFSVTPDSVVKLEARVAAVFGWMQSLGGLSDGLRRLIVDQLIDELSSTTHCFPPAVVSASIRSPSFQAELDMLNKDYSPCRAFDRRDQFPSVLLHLTSPSTPLPATTLRAPVYSMAAARASAPSGEEGTGSFELDFKSRLQRPFEHCHRDPLAIMLLGSPYLPVSIKTCINDLIIQFQHDLRFKASFSQQFTTLYPALNVLFCRNIGTAELTVFHTSVQVYTANSVVSMMSSDGIAARLRLLPEGPRPLMITTLLAATLQTVLLDAGCLPCGSPACATNSNANEVAFLTHHSIHTHRLSHLCRDLEYLTADSGFCTRLLCEDVDPGMLDIWTDVCSMLQCLDSYKRKADVHVEQEDERWQDAATLILELESVSGNIVSRALLDQVFAEERPTTASVASTASSSSSNSSSSNAASYTAPITSPYDKEQLARMREKAVGLCVHRVLHAISEWVATLPAEDGRLSTEPRRTFMGLSVDEYYCVEQNPSYPIPDVRGASSLPVSVHLPLHRMLGKLVHFAACGGVDLSEVVAAVRGMSPLQMSRLVEHPLRCLAFAAQVSAGMWRRNGYSVANLAYNYGRVPLSKSLRDMDIVALQVAVLALGHDAFLATLAARFELLNTFNHTYCSGSSALNAGYPPASWAAIPKAMNTLEYHPVLLAEMLRLLITLITYVPTSLLESFPSSTQQSEGWRRMLKREVVHQVLAGVQTVGQLHKIKVLVGSIRTVSDAMLMAVVDETCARRSDEEGSAKILSLKPESFAFFDPEFPDLPMQQQAAACERAREHVKSQVAARSDPVAFIPLVSAQYLPVPHKDFATVRQVLYCPAMFRLLELCISKRFANAAGSNASGPSSLATLSRAVHLLSLQVVCAGDLADPASARNLPYFRRAFSPEQNSDTERTTEVIVQGCGVAMLTQLAALWQAGDLQDDLLYHEGLGWALKQIYTHSTAGRELLQSKGVSFQSAGAKGDSAAAKLAKQKAAQQRAIEEAKRRTASAMAAFSGDMSSDEDEDGEDDTAGDGIVAGRDSSGAVCIKGTAGGKHDDALPECIVCRDKKDVPLGYLCFLQPSNLMRNAHLRSPDCPDLLNTFRVVAINGCKIFAQPNEDAAVLGVLPQGVHVLSENREGRWLHLKAPQKGWCSLYCNAEDAVNPPDASSAAPAMGGKMVVNVHPVADLQFTKHGGSRLHASSCGHTMHFECWDMLYAANVARSENNALSADLMSIDVSRRESLCPLCKSITNTLVPHTTTSTPATAIHMSDAATMLPLASQEFCVLATHAGPRAPWHNVAKEVEPNDVTLGSCFSRSMERGKLLSDGMFYDSCAQQSRFSWDHDTSDEPKISRNVDLLRTQHGVWSAAAYTLLSATCNKIRDRASSTSDAQDPTAPTLMCLSDLDTSLLKHMLALVWRSPSSMRYYYDYVSEPLLNLFEGAHFAVPRFQGGTAPKPVMRPADQFLTKSAQLTDIQRSLRSMPYESVAASFYPNTRTVASIARLAIDKGLPEQEAWAVLMMPLLVQDLHVIAVATVASSATLEAFVGLNQLLCVAKLVQTLLEPALNGQVDYFHDVVEGNVKKVDGPSKGQSQLSSLKGDCKHAHSFESGADNTPSKRSKTTDNNRDTTARVQDPIVCARGDPIASRAPSSFDTAIASLTQLREQACSAAGVPLTSKAPQGWNLLALALDSWIPYLEYAFHLRTLVFSISGVNVASHTTLLVPSGANFSVQSDVHHQHLRYKFIHAEQLMQGWGIASMEELVTVPLFVHLVQQWAGHLKVHYAAMDGAAESIEDGTSNSANATPPASGASGAGTTWIPTVPSDANRHTDSAHKHSSTSNQDLKSKDTSPTPRGLKIGAEGLPAASDGAALDIALRTMLMGIDPEAPLAVSTRTAEGQSLQQEEDARSDGGRMEDAMEDQFFDTFPGAVGGSSDGEDDMDEDSDDSEDSANNEEEDGDHEERFYSADDIFDADQIFGPGGIMAAATTVLHAPLAGSEEEGEEGGYASAGLPGAGSTDAATSATPKRKPSLWTLQGVYPVNPTVDFPSPELSDLAVAASEAEKDNKSVSYLLLMPVRAPLQGSLTGREPIVGYNGDRLQHLFPDLSHMGVGLRHLSTVFIPLPTIYTDLYQMFSAMRFNRLLSYHRYDVQVKFPSDSDKKAVDDPAICLVCGRVLNAGNKAQHHPSRLDRNSAGECTLHARSCGAGIGVFFLVQHCQVILIRGSRGVYSPSLYLDSSGEVSENRGQNKPLFLSTKRYKKLEEMYVNHQVGKEVVRKRASAESVIRLNWF